MDERERRRKRSDALSRRKELFGVPYRDMLNDTEDERVTAIGRGAMSAPGQIAFLTDDDPGKVERYIRKILKRFPGLECDLPRPGPGKGIVTVVVRRKNRSGEQN